MSVRNRIAQIFRFGASTGKPTKDSHIEKSEELQPPDNTSELTKFFGVPSNTVKFKERSR